MIVGAKISEKEYERLRGIWENDARPGFTWLVRENGLDVSPPAVRKVADRNGWKKVSQVSVSGEKPGFSAKKPKRETLPKKPRKKIVEEAEGAPLSDVEERFCIEYMKDWNALQAAIRAGIPKGTATRRSSQLKRSPRIQARLRELVRPRAERMGIDADALMDLWVTVATFDANELVEVRRVSCPWCYSKNGLPLTSPKEWAERRKKWDMTVRMVGVASGKDPGDYDNFFEHGEWYDWSRPINPDCIHCHGEGVERMFIHDTRYLSPAARMVYTGVRKNNRGDLEVLMLSKEKAIQNLALALGLFKDKEAERAGKEASPEELQAIFDRLMKGARERQEKVLKERGLTDKNDVTDLEETKLPEEA